MRSRCLLLPIAHESLLFVEGKRFILTLTGLPPFKFVHHFNYAILYLGHVDIADGLH